MGKNFWENLEDILNNNKKSVLCVIYETKESTPGKVGFKMYIDEDGNIEGTIGGGKVEYLAISKAKEMLEKNISYHMENYRHYGEAEDSTGMICYGEQLTGFILLNNTEKETIKKIREYYSNNITGLIIIGDNTFSFEEYGSESKQYEYREGIYKEIIGIKERIYIFGGGHVGLAISRIMSTLGFQIYVIDNRKDVFTIKDNIYADKIINEDFISFTEKIIEDKFSYVVIVTPGHKDDKEVLGAVINKKVKYIGLMGSSSKVKITFNELISEGIAKEKLEKIYAPIGLPIKSQTPAEIAISIAAQIITIKNN